jgi:hypothetical protein
LTEGYGQSGVLTQEEFDAEKAKLLGAPLLLPIHPAGETPFVLPHLAEDR